MLEEFHDGSSSGQFIARTTTIKIMRASYYWPITLFSDVHKWVRGCKKCAFYLGKQILASLPLHPIQAGYPFLQWVLEFIAPIIPPSSVGHNWILVETNYFTRWTKAIALKDATKSLVSEFFNRIVTIFNTPSTIISNNAKAFIRAQISSWEIKHNIYLKTSSNYYPEGNRLVESSNKNLIKDN